MNRKSPWAGKDKKTLFLRICVVFFVSSSVSLLVNYLAGTPFESRTALLSLLGATVLSLGVVLPFIWHMRAISKQHQMVSRALDVTGTSVILYNDKNEVTYFNDAAARAYESFGVPIDVGVTEESLFRTRAATSFSDPDQADAWFDKVIAHRKRQLASGEPFVAKVDDSDSYNQLWLTLQQDGGIAEIRTDVTLLKLQELALAEREKELEASRDDVQDVSNDLEDFNLSNASSATRILIVEDNPMNQLVVCGFLQKHQFNLQIADNGDLGVEAYKAQQPTLVLMDISMPVMNGLEATAAIRGHEEANGLSRCPILALTANAMQEDREACLLAGMDDFLTKPILSAKLDEKLRYWLSNAETANRAA